MIDTKQKANQVGIEVIKLEADLEALEAEEKKAINEIKEKNSSRRNELQAAIKKRINELAEYFWATTDRDPDTKGQLTLDGVRLNEKRSTEFKYPSPITTVCDLARANGWEQFIRVKEEPNKEEIRASATADQLKALKIKPCEITSVYVKAR